MCDHPAECAGVLRRHDVNNAGGRRVLGMDEEIRTHKSPNEGPHSRIKCHAGKNENAKIGLLLTDADTSGEVRYVDYFADDV